VLVGHFLEWARTAPVARRAEAAHALGRAFLYSPVDKARRDEIEAAITLLLDDPSPDIRFALADALGASADAPQHVILALLADQARIAALVAERSPVLLDGELVDLVASGAAWMQEAVARRTTVSRTVAAALAEIGSLDACIELLSNGGALVARFSLDRIIERFGGEARLRDLLLSRDDLPIDVRRALVAQHAQGLQSLVVERSWMTGDRAEAVVRDARDRATVALAAGAPPAEVAALAAQLIDAGEMTPSLLIRAIAAGEVAFFEEALAGLTGAPPARVRALVEAGRPAALAALLAQAGLPRRSFRAFSAAIEVLRAEGAEPPLTTDYRRRTALIDAIIAAYGPERPGERDQILALLRRLGIEAKREAARGFVAGLVKAA